MAHTTRDKRKLLVRVRRIKGQVTALETALDTQAECAAILQQLAAIRGAINGLMAEVLEGHLREHVAVDTHGTAAQRRELDTMLRILRSYLK